MLLSEFSQTTVRIDKMTRSEAAKEIQKLECLRRLSSRQVGPAACLEEIAVSWSPDAAAALPRTPKAEAAVHPLPSAGALAANSNCHTYTQEGVTFYCGDLEKSSKGVRLKQLF